MTETVTPVDTNPYSHDNQALSSPGSLERKVEAGVIDDPNGYHQPKYRSTMNTPTATNPNALPGVLNTQGLPPEQIIDNFDRRYQITFEQHPEGYREFVTYDGIVWIEFLKGQEEQAKRWNRNRILSGKTTHQEEIRKGRILFKLSRADSEARLNEVGLSAADLRQKYDTAEEITPYFTGIPRQVDGEKTKFFITETLETFKLNTRLKADLEVFDNRAENFVKYYIGLPDVYGTNVDDIGFYRDYGDRIRASYDPNMIHKVKPLLQDLINFTTGVGEENEEYVVGLLPNGMLQFVISKDLSNRLVKHYGGETQLVARWNDPYMSPKGFNMKDFKQFEEILVVAERIYVNSDKYLEYGQYTDGKK